MPSLLTSVLQTIGLSAIDRPSGAEEKTPTTPTATPATPPSQIEAQVAALRKAMVDMRTLLQRAGSLLATAGAAIVGGLGYQQLHSFFPIPPNLSSEAQFYLVTGVLGAALAAALGAALLARQFLTAQGRILLSSSIEGCDDLNAAERAVVHRTYREVSRAELANELTDVDLRAERLSRVALATSDPLRRAAYQSESDRLEGVVELAIVQSAVRVLERRSSNAFRGPGTAASLVLAIVGMALLFGLADYSKGERDKLDVVKKCKSLGTTANGRTTYPAVVGSWCKS